MKIISILASLIVAACSVIAGDIDYGGGNISGVSTLTGTNGGEVIGGYSYLSNSLMVSSWRNTDYFDLTILDVYTNAAPASGYSTNLDMIYAYYADNQVKNDKMLILRNIRGFPVVSYSVFPTNLASVSSNGYITHIADGLITSSVSTVTFGRTNEIYLPTRASVTNTYYQGVTGSIRRAAEDIVNGGITGATLNIYSTYAPESQQYVRATNLWFRPAPACFLAWRDDGSGMYGGGVLVTPKHMIFASHYLVPAAGTKLVFVRTDNTVVTNTVVSSAGLGSDISVVRLTDEITGIDSAKILTNVVGILPNGISGIPIAMGEVHANQPQLQLGLGNSSASLMETIGGGFSVTLTWTQTANPLWTPYFTHVPAGGDSGQPMLYSTGTDIILLAQIWTAGGGQSTLAYAPQIQAQITAWGDTNTLSYIGNEVWRRF